VYAQRLTNKVTKTLRKCRALDGHTNGAAYFTWSPNDKYLAVVGAEDSSDLWLWNVEEGKLRTHMTQSNEEHLVAVAWHRDSNKLVCGGTKGQFYQCVSVNILLTHLPI
jgi:WD40 repeat protein